MSTAPCRSCGHPLRAGVRVCTNCGVPVWSSDPPAGITTDPGPTSPVPVVEELPRTPTIPTPPPEGESGAKTIRLKGRHLAMIAGVVAMLLIGAVAAGALTAPEAEPVGDLVGELPFGPEGGTKAFDNDKGKIKVPKGALDSQQTIQVRRGVVPDRVTARSPDGLPLAFPAGTLIFYTFGPTTIVLNEPVTITLQIPVSGQGGLVFVTSGGAIRFFPGDVEGRTITFQLTSFDLTAPGAVVAI